MSRSLTTETSITAPDSAPSEISGFVRSLASVAFVLKLAAASTQGFRQCFLEDTAATQLIAGALAESSTQVREMTPEIRAKLEIILNAARHDVIEDGMPNAINQRLPELVNREFETALPALVSAIETGRITPIVAAEVLKELGRLRNRSSHSSRRWVLERALTLASPFIRDGAGLGLARLADPAALPSLRRAVDAEENPQTKADLRLVIDELTEISDGAPVTGRE
jgi:hypothetical protein